MKTISSVVEQYIKKKPFLQSALAQGIINLTSLSRIVKPEIEDELGKDIRNGAIVMALKRLSDDLEFRATHKIIKVLKNIGEITVRSSLTDFTFFISESISMPFSIARRISPSVKVPRIFFFLSTTNRHFLPDAFNSRQFTNYFTGNILSYHGVQIFIFAESWIVHELNDAPEALGLLGLI